MDRPGSRRVLRFDGAFGPEGCCGGFAADKKKGCGWRRGLYRRVVKETVDGPPARGFLRFLSLTRLRREGCCGGFAADDKVSVTGLAFWWEISRLRVSSKRFPSNTHTGASPPLEMTILAGAPIVISTVAERSGEISRLNGQESGCGFRRWLCRRAAKEKVDGPPARGFLRFLSLTRLRREGCGIALSGDEFYNASFGGHVHIKYHNQDYHRPPLRHFVALFP